MAKLSPLKIAILFVVTLLLLFMAVGSGYYFTTNYFEDNLSFGGFEQLSFPDWAYCERGIEYVPEREGQTGAPQIFRDTSGRPLEGAQDLSIGLVQRRELDDAVELVSLGLMRARAQLVQGVLEGPVQVWHENGQLALQCPYRNGLREGICKSYSTSGWLMNEVEYAGGKATGTFRSYRPDDTLLAEGRGGECQEYSVDGKTLLKKVSPGKAETKGCTPNRKEVFPEGTYVTRKEYKGFWKDGSLVQSATVWNYASGVADHSTIYREMIMNGRMFRQETFLWDLHVVQDFDQEGILRREIHDRGGVLEGTARWYDAQGRLRVEGANRGMLREGIFRWYGPDGKLAWMAFYSRGKPLGEDLFYAISNWLLFFLVEIIAFTVFFPVYVWLRKKIALKLLAYGAVLLSMVCLFIVASYFSFLILLTFFS